MGLSRRKGTLRIWGKGGRAREVPVHAQLRTALAAWLEERHEWPAAASDPALFLNQRGTRLGVRAARGTDLVIVAELLGHARLETTRGYTRPSAEDSPAVLFGKPYITE
ncbi:MAG: hypothetical protein M3083_10555 [Actinomycetota bacterium]|nr:hypothetical protein [Actinomycetota bacterium]MDQ6945413.1 hypothetical protein [Actinomycetota bacterium]